MSKKNNPQNKALRRRLRAERKAANRRTDKQRRPNNILLFCLIFGIIFALFAGIYGYRYFSKPATIEKYIKENKESFNDFYYTESTLCKFSAKKNSLKLDLDTKVKNKDLLKDAKAEYEKDEMKDQFRYMAALYLTEIKPQTRALSADVTITVNLNGEKKIEESLTYNEAKKLMKEKLKEYEEGQK